MSDSDASDGDYDLWPTEWDPDRDDLRWVPPNTSSVPLFLAFPTHLEAVEEANRYLSSSGFAITTDRTLYTKPSKQRPVRIVRAVKLRCGCGRLYKTTGAEKRHKTSRMTGCKWRARLTWVSAEESVDEGPGWRYNVEDPRHNHDRAGKLALPHHRKRDKVALLRIKNAMDNRDSAMKILRSMLSTGATIRRYDIANEMGKMRLKELGGRTRIQAVAEFLQVYSTNDSDNEYTKFYQFITQDEYNRARILFFSHPLLFDLIKANPDVVQIDATYKTNMFNMPLVHFIGITSRNTTYDIAYAFVPNEDEETYAEVIKMLFNFFKWLEVTPKCFITDHDKALKAALRAHFPDIPQRRCIWHINQNVQAKAVKYWDLNRARNDDEKLVINTARKEFVQHWHTLVACTTEEHFWAQWDVIEAKYQLLPDLLAYLNDHQLKYYTEWAECFCRYFPDFGQRVTSRVEGAYHQLKLALTSWTAGHIYDVVKDIHELSKAQRNEHDGDLDRDEARIAGDLSKSEFVRLQRRVSYQGLRKLKAQLELAKSDEYEESAECSGAFTSKFGLPCKHTLRRQLAKASAEERQLVIDPKDVHQHWYFRPARLTGVEALDERLVFDPAKVKPKGRRPGATTVTLPSSQPPPPTQASQAIRWRKPARQPRDKSRWEHVQATQPTQEAQETSEDEDTELRRGSRKRQPTQKAREMIEDPIEISSAEESSSEGEVIVQEVAVTRTTKKITRKVTKKPAAMDWVLASLSKLESQNQELSDRLKIVQKAQEGTQGFVDIDSINVAQDSPPKQTRKKRKGVQPKKPSIHASNGSKMSSKRARNVTREV